MRGHHAALALVAALTAGLTMRLWAFGGISGHYLADDSRYVAVAQNLANGFAPSGDAEWFGSRVAFLWPVALLFRVLAASDFTAVAWPLLGSLISIGAAYLVADALTGRRLVGCIAAWMVALAPLEVLVATRLRPDSLMPAFIALSVWAALRSRSFGARRHAHAVAWAASAGVFLGLAWSTREMALVMAPVVIAAAWRPTPRAMIAGIAGFVCVVITSMFALALAGGSALMPLTGTAKASSFRWPWEAFTWKDSYLAWAWENANVPGSPAYLALFVIAVTAALLVASWPHEGLLVAAWALWGYLYLEFVAVANLTPSPRFLTMLTIPLAVCVAIAVTRLPAWGVAIPIGLAVVATVITAAPVAERHDRANNVWRVAHIVSQVKEHDTGPVASEDWITFEKVRLFTARERITVPRAVDPGFLDHDARQQRTEADLPDPQVILERGVLLEVPLRHQVGAPANWRTFRAELRQAARQRQPEHVFRVDDAVAWKLRR